jgi:peptidoglycan biosynthesis protein MviN/MurJ (putative lipid II flippase)
MTLGATVISRATLPVFAEGVANGESRRSGQHALRWAALMFVAGAVAAALIAVPASWIVALLFERGAFTAEDTEVVAVAVRFGAWQLPPYLAGLVLVSMLAGQRRYDVITAAALVSIVVKLLANLALADSLGVSGLMLSSAAMYACSAALCWIGVLRLARRDAAGVRQSL